MRIDVLLYILERPRHNWLYEIVQDPKFFGLELVKTIKGYNYQKFIYAHKESGRFFGIKWTWKDDLKRYKLSYMGEQYQVVLYTSEKPLKNLGGGFNDLHCS